MAGAQGPALLEVRCVQISQRYLDGTDPFMQFGEQRAREIPADVLEEHPPVRSDGVVCELLGIDEFLDVRKAAMPAGELARGADRPRLPDMLDSS
jgi:hypothetical protein